MPNVSHHYKTILSTMSSPIIKLNVGGIFYDTTEKTLQGSDFFKALLKHKNTMNKGLIDDRYFIDRSGIAFEHVLNLLRNPDYAYPEEYLQELDFYAISHPQDVQWSNNTIVHELNKMKQRMNSMRKCKEKGCKLLPVENYPYCKWHGFFGGTGKKGENIKVGSVAIEYRDEPLIVEDILEGGILKVSSLYGEMFKVVLSDKKTKYESIWMGHCYVAKQFKRPDKI